MDEDSSSNVFADNTAQGRTLSLRLSQGDWPQSGPPRKSESRARPEPSWKAQGPHRPGATDVARNAARNAIAAENHASISLSADDIRFDLAQRAAASLEGGRAALLRPEKREALVRHATSRGMRPFDAHLVIAVVQDAGRRGDVIASVRPSTAAETASNAARSRLQQTLRLIPVPATKADDSPLLWATALGLVLGALALVGAVVLMGG